MEKEIKSIGILGGSGALGSGLSYRLGKAGYEIVVGSRNPGMASEKINEINQRLNQEKISIESNFWLLKNLTWSYWLSLFQITLLS